MRDARPVQVLRRGWLEFGANQWGLAAVLCAAALAICPIATASRASRPVTRQRDGATVQQVTVSRSPSGPDVHIEGSAPLQPAANVLSNPDRIVIDLAGAGYDRSLRIPVRSADLRDVRVSLFQKNPPVTRVVLDLARRCPYHLVAAGNTVIVHLDPAVGPQPQAVRAAKPSPIRPAGSEAALQPSPAAEEVLPVAAPAGLSSPSQGPAGMVQVQRVGVAWGKNGIQVQIESNGPVKAESRALASPDRIVVDLANARYASKLRIPVNIGGLESVRVSQYRSRPPMTRVVLDLAHSSRYRISSYGDTITVALENERPAASLPLSPAAPPVSMATANVTTGAPLAQPPAVQSSESPQAAETQATVAKADTGPLPSVQRIPPVTPEPAGTRPRIEESSSADLRDAEGPTTEHQATKATRPVSVRRVTVSRGPGNIEVHVEASGPLQPAVRTLSKPERIVVDLNNATYTGTLRIPVRAEAVREVNVALFLVNPPVTRVVLNLDHPLPYRLMQTGNLLTVTVGTEDEKTTVAQPLRPAQSR